MTVADANARDVAERAILPRMSAHKKMTSASSVESRKGRTASAARLGVGSVESIDIRTTVLLAENGDQILVPNAILFAEIILNRHVSTVPAAKDNDPTASDPAPI